MVLSLALAIAVSRRCVRAWRRMRVGIFGLPICRAERVDDEPETGEPGKIYVVEDGGVSWAAVMACPGSCGQMLHMNLLPDVHPVWKLTEHSDGSVSLSPSVWRREGCGCHFFVRNGRIDWA